MALIFTEVLVAFIAAAGSGVCFCVFPQASRGNDRIVIHSSCAVFFSDIHQSNNILRLHDIRKTEIAITLQKEKKYRPLATYMQYVNDMQWWY